MELFGSEGLISSKSISALPNDDVMETPEGDTPGERPEKFDRGDDGAEGGESPFSIAGVKSIVEPASSRESVLLFGPKKQEINHMLSCSYKHC